VIYVIIDGMVIVLFVIIIALLLVVVFWVVVDLVMFIDEPGPNHFETMETDRMQLFVCVYLFI